jgi:putative hydrolases of HD superfamily
MEQSKARVIQYTSVEKNIGPIVDFLFEVGILSQTPRSGFHFLGSGRQSVAEHVHRVMYIGYVLGIMEKGIDMAKILQMCLFHDLAESRTSDLNYVHQKYAQADHGKVIHDLANALDFGDNIKQITEEYQGRKTRESLIAKDADNLEWILSLKEQQDTGNSRAATWIPSSVKRLKTRPAKQLAKKILKTDSDHWWFANKEDEWWVSRGEKR